MSDCHSHHLRKLPQLLCLCGGKPTPVPSTQSVPLLGSCDLLYLIHVPSVDGPNRPCNPALQPRLPDLQRDIKVLFTATNPCWDWYAQEVLKVKTPKDAFKVTMARSNGAWARDQHLQQTVEHTLYKRESLAFMGLLPEAGPDQSGLAQQVLSLTWHVLARRAWSMAKYSAPPDAYAQIGSRDPGRSAAAVELMRQDWHRLIVLEQGAVSCPDAKELLGDIHFAAWSPIRLLFMFFQRDQWRVDSLAGRKLLRGFLYALPDSKIVEDGRHAPCA